MAGKRPPQSTAERAVRSRTAAVVRRVTNGAHIGAALRAAGYDKGQARRILAIGAGGEPDITDDGYRKACALLVSKAEVAAAEQDAVLAERWRALAVEGEDWRSIAELLKRRSPDEWNVTERTELELSGGVEARSEDAVLAALARLKGEGEAA